MILESFDQSWVVVPKKKKKKNWMDGFGYGAWSRIFSVLNERSMLPRSVKPSSLSELSRRAKKVMGSGIPPGLHSLASWASSTASSPMGGITLCSIPRDVVVVCGHNELDLSLGALWGRLHGVGEVLAHSPKSRIVGCGSSIVLTFARYSIEYNAERSQAGCRIRRPDIL